MSVSLLSTKLYIPPPRAGIIARPRLSERLLSGVNRPGSITLLSGPAGFGKTTLLSEFIAQLRRPVAWLSLDEGDNDPIRFWTYLIAACQSVQEGLGEAALALFRASQPLPDDTIPLLLINDLARLESSLALVLDDYHAILNPAIHATLAFLLDHLPANLHIVLSTRIDPPFPLARWRARNQLVEIRAQDLRFSVEEALEFLNRTMGLNLTAEEVAALEARTEGWIAGLQLAALSMQGRSDIPAFIQAFSGSHVYIAEYLVEEVIQGQPQDVQAFLLQTSVLERLNAELCEAVVEGLERSNVETLKRSNDLLRHLERANLFLIPLDDEGQWFRYHHLFADLLQARLRQSLPVDVIAALHQRAADWFEQAGMPSEAIEHARAAADYARVVRIVEKIALPMILQAYVRTIEVWLQAIPPKYFEHNPRINMAFAWMNLLRGTPAQAVPYLQRLEATFSASKSVDEDPSLQGEWLALQSKLLNMEGRPAESRDLANRALQILPEAEAHVRSMILVNLATAYQQMLDYDHAAETFQMIVRDAQAVGDHVSETLGTSGQAQMVLQQGRLHLAFEIASEGIKRLQASEKANPFSATLYGELGQIYYHWHQLDQAGRYFLRSVETSGKSGYSDPEIYRHVMLSRTFQMQADWAASAQEMQKASDQARKIPPAMIREEVISQQVRVDLALGHLEAAQAALKTEGFSFESGFGFPDLMPDSGELLRPVTHPAGLLYNSALRVLLFQSRTKQALENLKVGVELATLVLAGELQCQHIPIALETLLLRAQLYAELGDDRSSLADVAKALELAEPEGFISIFVEEGPPIYAALNILIESGLPGTVPSSYVQEILSAFSTTGPSEAARGQQAAPADRSVRDTLAVNESLAPVESLTPRELEVLQLIAAGDSNRTIAEKLVITVSAVKKHSANIYGKLNVNSRTQAVARARQLGLFYADE
jgi:ATP/maltotriose-dependent transcriptional regulator MalT